MRFDLDVDCLTNGAPHAHEAQALYDFFHNLPARSEYDFVRCYTTFDLFQKVEVLQEDTTFKIRDYQRLLLQAVDTARLLVENQRVYRHKLTFPPEHPVAFEEAEDFTKAHYGALFEQFDEPYYYDHSFVLMRERYFDRNCLQIDGITEKVALDCGCGGGRFTLVLKQMGFKQVYGIDFSEQNLATARAMRDAKGIQGVVYGHGDVLNLPYRDQSFHFVLSNGVLHCTPSIQQGLSELYRVVKPAGTGLLFVMEKPGGVWLDTVELLRVVMRPVNPEVAKKAMTSLGAHGHRLYNLLDHTQVPINTRTTPAAFEAMLRQAGFKQIKRLEHGLPYDKVEKLRRLGPHDSEGVWKYGVGENRYYLTK